MMATQSNDEYVTALPNSVQQRIANLEAHSEDLGRRASSMFRAASQCSSPEKRRALNAAADKLLRQADQALDAAQKLLVPH